MKKNEFIKKRIIFIIPASIFMGFVNGILGGGGGMLCVYLLSNFLNVKDKQAHATTILIMLPISLASSVIYLLYNSVQIMPTLTTTIGSIVGGIIGALLLKNLSNKFIRLLFSLIVIGAGLKMSIF